MATALPDFSDLGSPVQQQSAGALPDFSDLGSPSHPEATATGNLSTDIPRMVGTAAANTVAGLASLPRAAAQGVDWLGSKLGYNVGADQALGSIKDPTNAANPAFPDFNQAKEGLFQSSGGTEYQPTSEPGRMAMAAASAAPLALTGGGLSAVPSLAAGGAGAQLAADALPNHPIAAGLVGGALGGMSGNLAANAARRGVGLATGATSGPLAASSGTMQAEDAALADTAVNKYNIPLGASQTGGWVSRNLADLSNKLPMSGSGGLGEQQQTAYNRAVAGTFGADASRITPDVLAKARQRIGGVMNDVANRTTITPDNQFINDLANTEASAKGNVVDQELAPIQNHINNVMNSIDANGQIPGSKYQALTRFNTPLGLAVRSPNPNIRFYAGQVRDALDGALLRSAAPEDVGALAQARQQWKNLSTVEPLTLRADTIGGATPSTGDISPAALRGAVNQKFKGAAQGNGGDLDELARIGQRFLKDPQSSGTAERASLGHAGGLAAGVLGGEAGLTGALGGIAGLAANRFAVNPLLNSQALARARIAGSLNPNGFRFASPGIPTAQIPALIAGQQAPPFGWSPNQ